MKKSLISAIKKLLTKLGAEEIEGNNLVEVIDSGADTIEGGGSSGSRAFVVKMKTSNDPFDPTELDKTWREIKNASDNDIPVILKSSNGRLCYWFSEVYIDREEKYYVTFMGASNGKSIFLKYISDTETGPLMEVK